MSIVAPPLRNSSAVKPTEVCYDNNLVLSQGFFLNDNPLQFSLPLLIIELPLIFVVSTAIHRLLRPLGQSRIVSQILTGILLGRSVMCRSAKFQRTVFPARGAFILDTLSILSLIFFVFSIGVKTDLSLLKRPGKRAVVIGLAGAILPMALAMTTSHLLRSSFPTDIGHGDLIFELVMRLSLSAFAVVADALDELGLLNSELGRTAMSATLITDVINWVVSTGFGAWDLIVKANDPKTGVSIVAALIGFVLMVVFVMRPATLWVVKRTPSGELLSDGSFIAIVLEALFASLVTELSGYHTTMGPFLLGLALPGGMPLGVTMTEKLDSFWSEMFLPLYLFLAGFRTDFSKIVQSHGTSWAPLEIVFAVCYIGKLVGSVAAALFFRMPLRDALTVGLMMNIKGLIEVSFFNNWGDTEIATAQHFSVLMVTLLLNTAITTPLVKLLYNPSTRYVANKRRTLQNAKPGSALRVLICIHNEDHVSAFLDLLEAAQPTREAPIFLSVLHLTELAGRAASVLRPHTKTRFSPASDHIVNAFRYFEQQSDGAITIHPYVALAPIATMHNDVCSLALDRKVRLVILPFHKQSDGARETTKTSIRAVNRSVLAHAPCSVAILVDRGLPGTATCTHTNHLLQHVAVYFIGGADDREALAVGMRMGRTGSISLTVVRFVSGGGDSERQAADKLDDEMLGVFRERYLGNEGMLYVEKAVADGEGTVAVIRGVSEMYDLLIVGRRATAEDVLTSGLAEWSECPELGPLGDVLANMDFGGKVSILVVQQQQRVREEGGDDGDARPTNTAEHAVMAACSKRWKMLSGRDI